MKKVQPPFTDVEIKTSDKGFYQDYNVLISLVSKILVVALVIWAAVWAANANDLLGRINGDLLDIFNQFYIISAGIFFFFCFIIAIIPHQVDVDWVKTVKSRSSQLFHGFL